MMVIYIVSVVIFVSWCTYSSMETAYIIAQCKCFLLN